jgi:hypothetical protein
VHYQDESLVQVRNVLKQWQNLLPAKLPSVSLTGGARADDDAEFWFVRVDKLCSATDLTQMPRLQDLQAREQQEGRGSWLVTKRITDEEAFTAAHAGSILSVSHRCGPPAIRRRLHGMHALSEQLARAQVGGEGPARQIWQAATVHPTVPGRPPEHSARVV